MVCHFGATLNEEFIWQYVSFVFVHGTADNPVAVFGHLLLNLVIFLTVGVPAERMIGTKHMIGISVSSWIGYWGIQQPLNVTVNGASGIIWAYSVILLYTWKNQTEEEWITKEELKQWLGIMWVGVTLFMTIVPFLFGSDEPIWRAFIFGNVFHAQSVVIGFLYLWIIRPDLMDGPRTEKRFS